MTRRVRVSAGVRLSRVRVCDATDRPVVPKDGRGRAVVRARIDSVRALSRGEYRRAPGAPSM